MAKYSGFILLNRRRPSWGSLKAVVYDGHYELQLVQREGRKPAMSNVPVLDATAGSSGAVAVTDNGEYSIEVDCGPDQFVKFEFDGMESVDILRGGNIVVPGLCLHFGEPF